MEVGVVLVVMSCGGLGNNSIEPGLIERGAHVYSSTCTIALYYYLVRLDINGANSSQ